MCYILWGQVLRQIQSLVDPVAIFEVGKYNTKYEALWAHLLHSGNSVFQHDYDNVAYRI